MKKTKVDIAILSKTWLKPGEEMFIRFPRYNYVGNPRPNRKEGGVGLLLKDTYLTYLSKFQVEYDKILEKYRRSNLIIGLDHNLDLIQAS